MDQWSWCQLRISRYISEEFYHRNFYSCKHAWENLSDNLFWTQRKHISFLLIFFFQILFTIAIAAALGMAIFQTLSFKRRKQQNDIDSVILVKFLINCCSTMGTVLFCSAAFLTVYVYFVYKTQHVVKVLPPFEELKLIKCFFIFAFILKVLNELLQPLFWIPVFIRLIFYIIFLIK